MKRLFHILIFTIITMCASAQSSGVKSCVDAVILLTTYINEWLEIFLEIIRRAE